MKTSNILILTFFLLSLAFVTIGSIYMGKYVRNEVDGHMNKMPDTLTLEKVKYEGVKNLVITSNKEAGSETQIVAGSNVIVSRENLPFVMVKQTSSKQTTVWENKSNGIKSTQKGDTLKIDLSSDEPIMIEVPILSSINCRNVLCTFDNFEGSSLNANLDDYAVLSFVSCQFGIFSASASGNSLLDINGVRFGKGAINASGNSIIKRVSISKEVSVSHSGNATVEYCD